MFAYLLTKGRHVPGGFWKGRIFMDKYVHSDNAGSVKIADEVIATVASMAAGEIEGIVGSPGRGGLEVKDFLSKKGFCKGIKVETQENRVSIDVNISILYGYKIAEVAEKVQKKVLDAVTSMTGLDIERVNIHVCSVVFPKEQKEKERAEDKK